MDQKMKSLSRRNFLITSGAIAGSMTGARTLHAAASAITTKAPVAITPTIQPVAYDQVELLNGRMRQQFDTNHEFFTRLDNDRMLKPFRQAAGLAAPGDDMGGWYDLDPAFNAKGSFHGFVPGHSFGQYLSGLSRAYAVTGSAKTREKIAQLVAGFAPTVSKKFYENYHLPAYTYDKISCGLIDAYRFAGIESALDVHWAATEAVLPFLPAKALSRKEQYALPHKDEAYCWDETYTLPENFFLAYRMHGNPEYRKLGTRFLEDDLYFGPLAHGENVLPGEHAYSHVNAFSSAMQAYLVLGEDRYLHAASNGFDFLTKTQSFATGGWGPDETFRTPGSGELGESVTKTHSSFETPCGAYGHFKICRYLLSVTGDSRYGDSMERILYNTILGVKPLREDGSSFYYSDYNHHAHKGYHPDKWPCCSGTFPQITADYGISSYFADTKGIYVNLYVPSKLRWKQGASRITLTQQTHYPHANFTEMTIECDRSTNFALRLRIPAWAGAKSRLSINGKKADVDLKPGTFASLERTWNSGDRVALEFDIPLSLESIDPQHPNRVALQHGSLSLFAVNPQEAEISRAELLKAHPVAAESETWQANTTTGSCTLTNFAAISDEEYRLYHDVKS